VRCFVVAGFLLTSASRNPSAIAELLVNAAAITKPHSVEHLAADLSGYKVDAAIVMETHLKTKHANHSFNMTGTCCSAAIAKDDVVVESQSTICLSDMP